VHISTQAVFSGVTPPYSTTGFLAPVNAYGYQKQVAEINAQKSALWTILRPTFVLGVRPIQCLGRENPIEAMLSGTQKEQVCDRWFSPLFARDAARSIWHAVVYARENRIIHLGIPLQMSRYLIAQELNIEGLVSKTHDEFPGIAPRPVDTTYANDAEWISSLTDGLQTCVSDYTDQKVCNVPARARELALFLGIPESVAYARLAGGFHAAHADVADSFRKANPHSREALLDWYKQTEAYIWELSAYHSDPGCNYHEGTFRGIKDQLLQERRQRVLCLGDGIGDLTLWLRQAGIDAVYHDLEGSRTAGFAKFRYWMYTGKRLPSFTTDTWDPTILPAESFDAIVSLDFMEHLPNVPDWAVAIYKMLCPGGVAIFRNSFNCGSGNDGGIPCHLAINDHYERDWESLMVKIGFQKLDAHRYQKGF
jgi:hypothetical protein